MPQAWPFSRAENTLITVVSLAGIAHPRNAITLVKQPASDISLEHVEEFARQHFGLEFADLVAYYHPLDCLPESVNWQAHEFWHFIGKLRKAIEETGHKPIHVLKPTKASREDQEKWIHLINRFWLGKPTSPA